MLGSKILPFPFIYKTNRQGTKHATPKVDAAPQGVKNPTPVLTCVTREGYVPIPYSESPDKSSTLSKEGWSPGSIPPRTMRKPQPH